jgi:hypothetical protein
VLEASWRATAPIALIAVAAICHAPTIHQAHRAIRRENPAARIEHCTRYRYHTDCSAKETLEACDTAAPHACATSLWTVSFRVSFHRGKVTVSESSGNEALAVPLK